MKMIKILLTILVFTQLSFSAETKNEETTVELKEGGAVVAFSKEDGFKLSKNAIANLGVTYRSVKGSGPWTLPKSALVRIKHSTGVYRKWDGWITMVLVKVLSTTSTTVTIESVDLENQDEVAVTGVAFLRMAEADLNSDTVDACSH